MFAIFGAAGQTAFNTRDTRKSAAPDPALESKKSSWLDSKWSPMRVLSDAEYQHMLEEKLLRVEAEIALIDESIDSLRAQEREMASNNSEDRVETETK
jgi:hypothetical protein